MSSHDRAPRPLQGSATFATRESVRTCRWVTALFLLVLSAFRFYYASTHGLVSDEAYYWEWTRRLAPGYYDQGPGIAIAIRLGTLFSHSTGAVRLAAIVDSVILSCFGYALASRIFKDERGGMYAACFLNVIPMLFVGGILITHDSPQVTTWAAALYCLARACRIGEGAAVDARGGGTRRDLRMPRRAEYPPQPVWWLLVGALAGMSLDCKYTAVLFFPCLLMFLLKTTAGRAALRTPWPYLSILCSAIVASPPLIWNAGHNWPSLRHILNLGGAHHAKIFDTRSLGDYLAGQLLVAMLFLFTMGWASAVAWREGKAEDDTGLMLAACFSWPVWGAFLALSLHGQVEPNWPVPAYFSAAVVTPWLAVRKLNEATGWKRFILKSYYVVSVLSAVALIGFVLFSESALLVLHGPKAAARIQSIDRTNEMYGWGQLAEAVRGAGWTPGGGWKAAAIRYQDAAQLAFALPGQPVTYNLPIRRRHNQYDLWPPIPAGGKAIVVIPAKDSKSLIEQVKQLFGEVYMVRTRSLWRNPPYSTPIATYILLRCTGYRGGKDGILLNEW